MKILFSAYHNPNFRTITEYCENALSELGHECFSFDDRDFIFPGRIRSRLSILERFDLRRLNRNLVRKAIKHRPDICIVAGGHRIAPESIKALKKLGVITVLWTIDPPVDFEKLLASAPLYDYVFCGGTEAIGLLKDLSLDHLEWLPFACDEREHFKIPLLAEDKQKYGSDICFVGSYYPNREILLEGIADFNLGIWGPGWEKIDKDSPLLKCVRKAGPMQTCEWLKVLSASRIAIVVHYQDGNVLCNQASPKLYEAMACGIVTMCDRQKDPTLLFKHGQELLFFDDISDLRHKICEVLANPSEGCQISQRAVLSMKSLHTYKARMVHLLSTVMNEVENNE